MTVAQYLEYLNSPDIDPRLPPPLYRTLSHFIEHGLLNGGTLRYIVSEHSSFDGTWINGMTEFNWAKAAEKLQGLAKPPKRF